MRLWQQKQIQSILGSLQKIHEEIKARIIKRDIDSVWKLLTECQESAIEVGNAIEKEEGEACKAIHYLEDYCERLYEASQLLNIEQDIHSSETIFNLLTQSIELVRDSIQNDITVRKEVVFFPYKASMWDSLESVYLAAKEDPSCDAYCVPIPYFDKNPDGSFREVHYEGNEYPGNIEITDWENYNFEERRPDVIYIHNPYDECNYVTSVHPRFYASNLKKYTKKLVYIPYFVLEEIDPENQPAIDKMKGFCYLPGTVYSDKVILQSENMKKIFISEFMKIVEKNGEKIDRAVLEERFLGLGSPKLDVATDKNKEDIEIPDSWRKLITTENGQLKKIVFYNVTVTGLLRADAKMIEKMKYVFAAFKENQNEITLLWRPHPLVEATIASMRPELWKQYRELVERYKEEGWGIFDDTADIHRAIEISDAYYGDMSSVVQMYEKTGKPIMLQNADKLQMKDENSFYVATSLRDKNDFYFVPVDLNVLVKYDISQNKTTAVIALEKEGFAPFCFYSKILKYNNKLILIPLHAQNFVMLDLNTMEMMYIPIPYLENNRKRWGYFSTAYLHENLLYAIGYMYPGIIRLDLDSMSCSLINYTFNGNSGEKVSFDGKIITAYESTCVNQAIYILPVNSNLLVKYEEKSNDYKVYYLDNEPDQSYRTIAFDGNSFWLTRDGKRFLKWNEDTLQYEKVLLPETLNIPEDALYRYSVYSNGKIYLASSKEAPIIAVDCFNPGNSKVLWKNENRKVGYKADYLNIISADEISFAELYEQSTYFINTNSDMISSYDFIRDDNEVQKVFDEFSNINLWAEGGVTLENLLATCKKTSNHKNIDTEKKGTDIWNSTR